MRLIDQIRADGRAMMPVWIMREKEQEWATYATKVLAILMDPQLPVVLCDNVAEYYYVGTDQEHWDLRRDFPNLAPPYEFFWTEHKLVTRIHSKECGDTDMSSLLGRGGRVGVVWVATTPDRCAFTGDLPEGVKWVVWADIFIDYDAGGRYANGPHGAIILLIDAEGRLIETPAMYSYAAAHDAEIMKSLITWLHPSLLAISFMHCKNVTIVEERVDKPLAKKHYQKTGKWPTRYRTLVIEPLKQILRHEGRSHEVGLARAMHICRGHFADYTTGPGLFGKYHGRYWIPAIVRGSRKKRGEADGMPPREVDIKL